MHLIHHSGNAVNGAKEDWFADFLFGQLCSSANHLLIIPLREHNALVSTANLIDDATHNGIRHAQSSLEIFSVGLH